MSDEQKRGEAKRPWLDLNGNGVPDYEESWFWGGLWTGVSWLVRTFAKPNTLVYRAVDEAERFRAAAQPTLRP